MASGLVSWNFFFFSSCILSFYLSIDWVWTGTPASKEREWKCIQRQTTDPMS